MKQNEMIVHVARIGEYMKTGKKNWKKETTRTRWEDNIKMDIK
jgi:hypothetical protein